MDAQVTDLTAPASGSEAPRRGAGRTPRLRCREARCSDDAGGAEVGDFGGVVAEDVGVDFFGVLA